MGRPDSDPITGRQQCGNFTAYYSSDPDGNLFYSKNPVFAPIRLFPDMVRALVGTKAKKDADGKSEKKEKKEKGSLSTFQTLIVSTATSRDGKSGRCGCGNFSRWCRSCILDVGHGTDRFIDSIH